MTHVVHSTVAFFLGLVCACAAFTPEPPKECRRLEYLSSAEIERLCEEHPLDRPDECGSIGADNIVELQGIYEPCKDVAATMSCAWSDCQWELCSADLRKAECNEIPTSCVFVYNCHAADSAQSPAPTSGVEVVPTST